MKKKLIWLAMATAMFGLGLSMPSCPGQQALQDQIDNLKTSQDLMNKKVQNIDASIKTMTKDSSDMKVLVSQMGNTVLAQKKAIEDLDAAFKDAQAKAAAAKSSSKKSGKRRY